MFVVAPLAMGSTLLNVTMSLGRVHKVLAGPCRAACTSLAGLPVVPLSQGPGGKPGASLYNTRVPIVHFLAYKWQQLRETTSSGFTDKIAQAELKRERL